MPSLASDRRSLERLSVRRRETPGWAPWTTTEPIPVTVGPAERNGFPRAGPRPGMSRRGRPVPEAAPLVGLVLAFAFALYGFLTSGNHLATALGSVVLLYPFVGFGLARSARPEAVFRPDPVLAVGSLGGALVALYGVVTGQHVFGALVAAVVALPPALYHARYGEPINPLSPDATLALGLLLAAALLVSGLRSALLPGALAAALVGLASVDYRRQRGAPMPRRTRTAAIVCCLGGGLAAFGLLTASGRPTQGLAAGSVVVAVGAFLALGAESR